MSDFKRLLSLVDAGMGGKTPWIHPPYDTLRSQFGLGRSVYTLVGGQSSTGKSAFVHWTYVLGAYGAWKRRSPEKEDVKLRIFVYAMERPKLNTIAKWVALKVMLDYGIILDVPTVLGFGTAERRLSEEERRMVESCRNTFEEMFEECVTLIDLQENPTGIFKRLRRYAYENGSAYRYDDKGSVQVAYLQEKEVETSRGKRREEVELWKTLDNPLPSQIPTSKYAWHYVPNDENLITLVVIDHIGLVSREGGKNQKENLDTLSMYMQTLRDRFYFSPVVVSQFNRNEQDIKRRGFVEPEAQDFEGSSKMYQDADVVLALFNPHKYGIGDFKGYKVGSLVSERGENRFRGLKILKNSYGADDLLKGMHFVGETGYFNEMPPPDLLTEEAYEAFRNPVFK